MVGVRLAAAVAPLYGLHEAGVATTGPTISGCRVDTAGKIITLMFNQSLLGGDKILVSKYGPPERPGESATISSSMHVLIDDSYW